LQYEPKGWGFAQELLAKVIRNRIFTADKKCQTADKKCQTANSVQRFFFYSALALLSI